MTSAEAFGEQEENSSSFQHRGIGPGDTILAQSRRKPFLPYNGLDFENTKKNGFHHQMIAAIISSRATI